MIANLLALAAISLWALLAWLGVSLAHVPPFLLTGIALMIGSVLALPLSLRRTPQGLSFNTRAFKLKPTDILLGVYGLFGFHLLLFMALRYAPPVQANLVNYLWPLGIVIMAPLFLPGVKLTALHIVAALMGFGGAASAILGGQQLAEFRFAWGFIPALGSAFVWASYSLMSKRLALRGQAFETASIGIFGFVSGALALLCHALMEPAVSLSAGDWLLIVFMGLGPMGAAFYLWDAALKRGDAKQIGILSYIGPLASTAILILATGQRFTTSIFLATALIIGAAILGTLKK
jgi:drug/metabolite transporter (DMT)-like permease